MRRRQLGRSDVRQRPGRHVPGHDRRPARRAAVEGPGPGPRRHADPPVERWRGGSWRRDRPSSRTTRSRPSTSSEQNSSIGTACRTPNAAARELGVDPRDLIAQAALETGWGTFAARSGDSHNLFGIKAGASWSGAERSGRHPGVRRGRRRHASDAELPRLRVAPRKRRDYVRADSRQPALRRRALNTGSDVQAFANALATRRLRHRSGLCPQVAAVAAEVRAKNCRESVQVGFRRADTGAGPAEDE